MAKNLQTGAALGFLEEFIRIDNIQQCLSNDDIAKFRYLCRRWVNTLVFHFEPGLYQRVPWARRYYQMTLAEHLMHAPDSIMAAALRPESDFDRRESALWLKDLMHRIHLDVC